MNGQGNSLACECSCPSISDKNAHEIAHSWVFDGYNAARQKFDAITEVHRMNGLEAVNLAQKVAYHKGRIEGFNLN